MSVVIADIRSGDVVQVGTRLFRVAAVAPGPPDMTEIRWDDDVVTNYVTERALTYEFGSGYQRLDVFLWRRIEVPAELVAPGDHMIRNGSVHTAAVRTVLRSASVGIDGKLRYIATDSGPGELIFTVRNANPVPIYEKLP